MADKAAAAIYDGIDVSAYQGSIDWASVRAAHIDFAMIRASSGRGSSAKRTDSNFHRNVYEASMAGIYLGAYHYSFATTADEAHSEAECFLRVIDGYKFAYPVAIDIEDRELNFLSNDRLNAIANAWCDDVRAAGLYPMIRANTDTLIHRLASETSDRNESWMILKHDDASEATFGMCQYASGRVEGIQGRVNLDRAYKNYPKIIGDGGLNGFGHFGHHSDAKPLPLQAPADRVKRILNAISELESLMKLTDTVLDSPGAKASPSPAAVNPSQATDSPARDNNSPFRVDDNQQDNPPVQTEKKKTFFHFPFKSNEKQKRIP